MVFVIVAITADYIPHKNIPSSTIFVDAAIYLIVIYPPLEVGHSQWITVES